MTLARHHRTRSSATTRPPFWLLTVPRWTAPADCAGREVRPAPETRWKCARCGALATDIAAASEHINLHSLHVVPRPPASGCVAPPAPAPARADALLRPREEARSD
jgi:hypothetical protein